MVMKSSNVHCRCEKSMDKGDWFLCLSISKVSVTWGSSFRGVQMSYWCTYVYIMHLCVYIYIDGADSIHVCYIIMCCIIYVCWEFTYGKSNPREQRAPLWCRTLTCTTRAAKFRKWLQGSNKQKDLFWKPVEWSYQYTSIYINLLIESW